MNLKRLKDLPPKFEDSKLHENPDLEIVVVTPRQSQVDSFLSFKQRQRLFGAMGERK